MISITYLDFLTLTSQFYRCLNVVVSNSIYLSMFQILVANLAIVKKLLNKVVRGHLKIYKICQGKFSCSTKCQEFLNRLSKRLESFLHLFVRFIVVTFIVFYGWLAHLTFLLWWSGLLYFSSRIFMFCLILTTNFFKVFS